ncbi:hexose transporter [Apiospora hydei]|uniref:Hexose transporter n=1 Tax=Apiospora hydei TaxID=1337664 RepID=A0ABR1WM25_9PEZI
MNGLLILPSYTEYFHLTTATVGLNNAASWIGAIVGALAMQPVADVLGRKRGILVASLITIAGVALQAGAQHIAMFVVARVVVGFGSAISNASAPVLLAELLPARTRGRVLGIFFSCFYVGSLVSAIVNYGSRNIQSTWSWRLPSLLQFIPSFLALCLLPFVPESPRWLISKGQDAHAKEILYIMQGSAATPNTENDNDSTSAAEAALRDIKSTMQREEAAYPRNAWRELLATPPNRRRLLILVSFGTMISTLGNFVISYYLKRILDQAGVADADAQLRINVGLNCWCFLAAAAYGDTDNQAGIYSTIAVIFLFQGFYSFAITPTTSLFPSEIAQYKLRAAGIAVFRFFDSGFGLLCSFAMGYAMEGAWLALLPC